MTRPLTFGICTDQNMPWELTVERWRMFERFGFDSAWLCDHLVQPSRPTGPYFEAYLESGMNQFLIDQPADSQLGTMERIAADVLPALRTAGTADREPLSGRPARIAAWSRPADYG